MWDATLLAALDALTAVPLPQILGCYVTKFAPDKALKYRCLPPSSELGTYKAVRTKIRSWVFWT